MQPERQGIVQSIVHRGDIVEQRATFVRRVGRLFEWIPSDVLARVGDGAGARATQTSGGARMGRIVLSGTRPSMRVLDDATTRGDARARDSRDDVTTVVIARR